MRSSLALSQRQIAVAVAILLGVCLCWTLVHRFMPPRFYLPGPAQTLVSVLLFLALYVAPPAAVAWFGYRTRKPLPALLLGLAIPPCTTLLLWLGGAFTHGVWIASLFQDDRVKFGFSAFLAASSLVCWGAGGAFLRRDKVATALFWAFALFLGFHSFVISVPWD